MKICLISYEYAPFTGGGMATYHNAAAKALAQAGHEVHVVTNAAWHGSSDPSCTRSRWQDGNLHIHRLSYFDEEQNVPANAHFLDVVPSRYGADTVSSWTLHPSNQAAYLAAHYVESLHATIGLDVIESPEFFAEAFYILRRRASGERHRFPPVCVHGHISSRIASGADHFLRELGDFANRQMMLREEYCVQQADALITPSQALMHKYEAKFGDRLPALRDTIPLFLDLPELGDVPKELAKGRYLATLGRIEPRKGIVQALRAFAALAADHPDLKLALVGKMGWHGAEDFDAVLAAELPKSLRKRVVLTGHLPRADALATAKNAAAFLHAVPWDNYPCAVLEAMGAGAACVVSDQGGHAEMVEDGESGLIVPAGDEAQLIAAVRKVLGDAGLAGRLRKGAVQRVATLTDTAALVQRKLAVYEGVIANEAENAADDKAFFDLPPRLQALPEAPRLPGSGLVVIDATESNETSIQTTCKSVHEETLNSPDWKVAVLVAPGQEVVAPDAFEIVRSDATPPWVGLAADTTVVYALAGARFDFGKLGSLAGQLVGSRQPCGSFLWLRPANVHVFPYTADIGSQDLFTGGRTLPPVFALRAEHLAACDFLTGLFTPQQRLSALMAAASLGHDLLFQHTGSVCGDFYGDLPLVCGEVQLRAMGYLDVLDLLPRHQCIVGNTEIPMTPNADIENLVEKARAAALEESGVDEHRDAVTYASNGLSSKQIEGLRRAASELDALKQMKIVRFMRKIGAFNLARKLFPKSKKMIG